MRLARRSDRIAEHTATRLHATGRASARRYLEQSAAAARLHTASRASARKLISIAPSSSRDGAKAPDPESRCKLRLCFWNPGSHTQVGYSRLGHHELSISGKPEIDRVRPGMTKCLK